MIILFLQHIKKLLWLNICYLNLIIEWFFYVQILNHFITNANKFLKDFCGLFFIFLSVIHLLIKTFIQIVTLILRIYFHKNLFYWFYRYLCAVFFDTKVHWFFLWSISRQELEFFNHSLCVACDLAILIWPRSLWK